MEEKKKNFTRFITQIRIDSLNDLSKSEALVNRRCEQVSEEGGKVVSIIPHNFGFSPMTLVYDIIYEAKSVLNFEEG